MHIVHCTACSHCIQFGAETSAVFYTLHAVARPCITCIMQNNANRALARCAPHYTQYRNVTAVRGCEHSGGGGEALPDLGTPRHCCPHMLGFPRSTLSVLWTLGEFSLRILSTLRCYENGTIFLKVHCLCVQCLHCSIVHARRRLYQSYSTFMYMYRLSDTVAGTGWLNHNGYLAISLAAAIMLRYRYAMSIMYLSP